MSENNQTDQFNTPILFIVFNRPDLTKKVFATIKEIRPKQLFIAADGPRSGNANDAIKCQEVRDYLLANIDWDCQLQTLFREDNLGCALACSGAIKWFFDSIEEGIIIEDDCLPDLSFFRFCSENLERYRHHQRIMHISGVYFGEPYLSPYSYYFSEIVSVGAWASWRRAWQQYDISLSSFPQFQQEKQMSNIYPRYIVHRCWEWIFNFLYQEERKNTRDYQWAYAVFSHGGLSINPGVNLITNIGFTGEATHGSSSNSPLANKKSQAIILPLKHPHFILPNLASDRWKNYHLVEANWHVFGVKQLLRKIGLFTLVKRAYYLLRKK